MTQSIYISVVFFVNVLESEYLKFNDPVRIYLCLRSDADLIFICLVMTASLLDI